MRLSRGEPVAGLDPELARRTACEVHRWDWPTTGVVAARLKLPPEQIRAALGALHDADFLVRRDAQGDPGELDEWSTTVRGGALAQASFLKPISRVKAQSLREDVLERARALNADSAKVVWVTQMAVFGSFLDPEVAYLGDVDLQITLHSRPTVDHRARERYIRDSGRNFPNIVARVCWPEQEAKQILRNRSPYISLHEEDISRFTDRVDVVYEFTAPDGG